MPIFPAAPGPGPEDSPENMHLASVGMTADGEPFDLIITSETEYVPRNAANYNGINGAIPQINLAQDEGPSAREIYADMDAFVVILRVANFLRCRIACLQRRLRSQ